MRWLINFSIFFIDDFIINKIVQCTDKKLKEREKVLRDNGKNITIDRTNAIEIRGLIGVLLLLGVTKK